MYMKEIVLEPLTLADQFYFDAITITESARKNYDHTAHALAVVSVVLAVRVFEALPYLRPATGALLVLCLLGAGLAKWLAVEAQGRIRWRRRQLAIENGLEANDPMNAVYKPDYSYVLSGERIVSRIRGGAPSAPVSPITYRDLNPR